MATCKTCKGKKSVLIPCPLCSDTTEFLTKLQIALKMRCDECWQYSGDGEVYISCPCTQSSKSDDGPNQ